MGCFFILLLTTNQVTKLTNQLTKSDLRNWQNRKEWFFKREHTDTYEEWYGGRYKRAEIW